MPQHLETTVDKFTFGVAADRFYTAQGVWVLVEVNGRVRVGLADFPQQRNGDVAFASVKPAGTKLLKDEPLAEIETVKATVELLSPVSGTVVESNPALETMPEVINQDPYGEGWLALIEATAWEAERGKLLEADTYFSAMRAQALEESRKL